MGLRARLRKWWKSTAPRDAELHFGTPETLLEAAAVRNRKAERWVPDYNQEVPTLFKPRTETEEEVNNDATR